MNNKTKALLKERIIEEIKKAFYELEEDDFGMNNKEMIDACATKIMGLIKKYSGEEHGNKS